MATNDVRAAPTVDAPPINNKDHPETKVVDETAAKATQLSDEPGDSVKEESAVNATSKPTKAPGGLGEPQPGNKRPRDENEASSASKKPNAKKEKPTESKASKLIPPTGGVGSSANGEKKKAGRPKKGTKVKDTLKKVLPRSTEGIGSRTRSRAKLAE